MSSGYAVTEETQQLESAAGGSTLFPDADTSGPGSSFLFSKRLFDIIVAMIALPLVAVIGILLMVINPVWNPGPVIFAQPRMGRGCRPFKAYKFRTMLPVARVNRGPDDPLEVERITPLGRFLRRARIDELPQFINVLMGEMSLVGPRPDYWEHAIHYAATITGYRQRHRMRPGITGLAQVSSGYAEGLDQTLAKTRHDLRYIATTSWSMDLKIMLKTARVMLTGFGAR